MKTAEDLVIDFYDKVLEEGTVDSLSSTHRFVYYIISIRCSIDIGGFSSVYEQLIPQLEFENIISNLNQIGEANLSNAFEELFKILINSKFYESFALQETDFENIQRIEEIICGDDILWELDTKLAELI